MNLKGTVLKSGGRGVGPLGRDSRQWDIASPRHYGCLMEWRILDVTAWMRHRETLVKF